MNPNDMEPITTDEGIEPTPTVPLGRRRNRRREAFAGALLVAGGAGAAFLGPVVARAESPVQTASTPAEAVSAFTPATGTVGLSTIAAPAAVLVPMHGGGGRGLRADDLTAAATAIGITPADLSAALASGQTLGAIATAHNVTAQAVIDALVKVETDRLAAAVTAGTITQAQADVKKVDLVARVTDQVNNGVRLGGGPGGKLDLAVAATTIGITEAELRTALTAGQTLAAVATAHNVTAQTLIDALVKAETDRLAAAVTAGTITQAQADAKKADLPARMTTQVNNTFQFGGPGGRGGHGGGIGADDLAAAATAIGITPAELTTALGTGQTLAAIATANGKTAQAVIDALVKAETDKLAAAVTAGTITQAQADAKKADLVARVTNQVNNGVHLGGPGGPGRGLDAASLTAAATAIGITEAELTTALTSGQTLAAIATAHNVTAQVVIDALVKAETDELAAKVTAGTITQAQADARKVDLVARITAQVNTGVGPGGRGGHGGHGGRGGFGGPGGAPAPSSTSTQTQGG
jgi:hypothetical protein